MARFKVIYDMNACIGAGECENVSPERWKVNSKSKSDLKGAKLNGSIYELEISEAEYAKQKEVAGRCPSGCIRVIKLE